MLQLLFISSVLVLSCAKPHYGNIGNPRNVITVPPNCPVGQEWINGQCRDIWRSGVMSPSLLARRNPDVNPGNVVIVPANCPNGQEYFNGQCRDIWNKSNLANSNVLNQLLERLWSDNIQKVQQSYENGSPRHIINVPNHCPIGFRPDALGKCRPIL